MESVIKLSISLLVSNRKDTIRKCMESLQPLVKAVSCEIIAVDTGSTDGSIEIVKKYTDKIISFPWRNDFSAARNAGLKQATGEWFLFLDDDEWFESTEEIIAFLTGNESRYYQRLFYKVRNYRDFVNPLNYEESLVSRMTIRTDELHFEGKVHECILPVYGRVKYVNDFVHHYGYAFKTWEEKKKHTERNITLLEEELKDDQESVHNLLQLAQEYLVMEWYEQAQEFIQKGIEVCVSREYETHLGWFYATKARIYVSTRDVEGLKRYVKQCETELTVNELAKANIYEYVVKMLLDEKENKLGIEYGKKYFALISWLRSNSNKVEEQNIMSLEQALGLRDYTEMQTICVEMYVRENQWYEAWKLIEKIDWKSGIGNLVPICGYLFQAADAAGMFGQLKTVMNAILESDAMQECLEQVTEKAKYEMPERKEEIIDLFLGIRKETPYVLLQKFKSALFHGKEQDARLYWKRHQAFAWEEQHYYGDFIWLALEYDFAMQDFIEHLDFSCWELFVRNFQERMKTEDIIGAIKKLEQQIGRESKKFLYARMILLGSRTEESSYFEALGEFLYARKEYLQSLEPDEENRAGLEAVSFIEAGNLAFKNKEFLKAKKKVTEGMRLDKQLEPYLVPFLEKILEELQIAEGAKIVKQNPEFIYLARQLKENVMGLIRDAKQEEALELLKALKSMMPGDKETDELYRECEKLGKGEYYG